MPFGLTPAREAEFPARKALSKANFGAAIVVRQAHHER